MASSTLARVRPAEVVKGRFAAVFGGSMLLTFPAGMVAVLGAALPTVVHAFIVAKEHGTFADGASSTILLSTVVYVAAVLALLVPLSVG